jgi:hypothetical protein
VTADAVLDVAAVAKLLRCADSTVEDRARRGDLPGLLFGDGGWIFPAGALLARLDELALDESAKRRAPPPAPRGQLRELPAGKRAKRPLPVLP